MSRRQFLKEIAVTAGSTLSVAGLPAGARTMRASSPHGPGSCGAPRQALLDLAATLEALTVTAWYQAIRSDFFIRLASSLKTYVRAALDADHAHYRYLVDNGAHALATSFYFPANNFDYEGLRPFQAMIEQLETAAIGLYLAAARQFAEGDEPVMAEIAGQILGVEAEHRIVSREILPTALPFQTPPNDICFERAPFGCVSDVMATLEPFLRAGAGSSGPLALPQASDIASAVSGAGCEAVPEATASTCEETVVEILNIAATAEALGITFYYGCIRGAIFAQLPAEQQWYLQAALDEERHHLAFLQQNGGVPGTTSFFFPARVFDDLALFLAVLDTFENAFIGAYLAAAQRFARLGQPLLAEIAGQIMGVEAEHRVLGRVVGGKLPPNNLCLERASYECVSDAIATLAPFVQPSAYPLQVGLPGPDLINSAVDRFGCADVPTAKAAPFKLYIPAISR